MENEKESANSNTDGKKKSAFPEKPYRVRDYGINYLAFLLTQVMGNGITSLDTMMGMFGLGVHSGSHREWTFIAGELGRAEQERVDKIQNQNILTEIAAMKSWQATMGAQKKWMCLQLPHLLVLIIASGVMQ